MALNLGRPLQQNFGPYGAGDGLNVTPPAFVATSQPGSYQLTPPKHVPGRSSRMVLRDFPLQSALPASFAPLTRQNSTARSELDKDD